MKQRSRSFSTSVLEESKNSDTVSRLISQSLVNTLGGGDNEMIAVVSNDDSRLDMHISKISHARKCFFLSASTILGTGVGLAMMPIFNKEIEELKSYGIDVHYDIFTFTASTINTLLISGLSSIFFFYHYFCEQQEHNKESTKFQKALLNMCKVGSAIGSLIHVNMLWNIELQDQKNDESKGFDQFIAWAALTMLPLMLFKTISLFEGVSKFIIHNTDTEELNSLGSKLVTYGISVTSLFGRGISLTTVFNELQKEIGLKEEISLPISILLGGIIGNTILGLCEYADLKKLFTTKTDGINLKQLSVGLLSTLESSWLALPIVSNGLNATKDWDVFLKAALFSPFFLSHMNSEAMHLYHSILPKKEVELDTTQFLEEHLVFEEVNNETQLLGEHHSEII